MITPHNLINHELIGLKVNVVNSRNVHQMGLRGRVVDETLKMLTIETGRGEKKVEKRGSTFVFTIPSGKSVRVNGDVLYARPEDRIKKRLKVW